MLISILIREIGIRDILPKRNNARTEDLLYCETAKGRKTLWQAILQVQSAYQYTRIHQYFTRKSGMHKTDFVKSAVAK